MIRSIVVVVVVVLVAVLLLDNNNRVVAFGPQQSKHSNNNKNPWGLSRSSPSYYTSSSSSASSSPQQQQTDKKKNEFRVSGPLFFQRRKQQQHAFPTSLNLAAAADSSRDEPVKFIIAGAPASGKGTQCEAIKEKYGLVHLSTGDMLRAAVADRTEVGIKAKEYMESGKLVPDEVIIGVVKDRLNQEDCIKNGWLLDGFPRTPAQAKALEESGISADCFIFLNVPDEILVERVVGRRSDPETGKIYHMTFSPPEDDTVKARLVQRADDTEEKVKVRLEQFHTNVDAVKDSYAEIGITIDGNQAPDSVSEQIFTAIDTKLSTTAA